jgi:hypothetical protein
MCFGSDGFELLTQQLGSPQTCVAPENRHQRINRALECLTLDGVVSILLGTLFLLAKA